MEKRKVFGKRSCSQLVVGEQSAATVTHLHPRIFQTVHPSFFVFFVFFIFYYSRRLANFVFWLKRTENFTHRVLFAYTTIISFFSFSFSALFLFSSTPLPTIIISSFDSSSFTQLSSHSLSAVGEYSPTTASFSTALLNCLSVRKQLPKRPVNSHCRLFVYHHFDFTDSQCNYATFTNLLPNLKQTTKLLKEVNKKIIFNLFNLKLAFTGKKHKATRIELTDKEVGF